MSNGHRVSLWNAEIVLRFDSGEGRKTVHILKTTARYTLKGEFLCYVNYI